MVQKAVISSCLFLCLAINTCETGGPPIQERVPYFLESGEPTFFPGEQYAVVNADDLIVRTENGTIHPEKAYLKRGDRLKVLTPFGCIIWGPIDANPNGEWIEVENASGETGWIANQFVDRFEVPVNYFLESGKVRIEPGQSGGRINRNRANIRSGPGTNYQKIGYAFNGDTLEVLGGIENEIDGIIDCNSTTRWIHVANNNKSGYIAFNLVNLFEIPDYNFSYLFDEVADNNHTAFVKQLKSDSVGIRRGPGINYKTIDSVRSGAWLFIRDFNDAKEGPIDHRGRRGRWLRIYSKNGYSGYIMERYVERGFSSLILL